MLEPAVDRLCRSFEDQCRCYERLWEITKRAAGQFALSRGDFSSFMNVMGEKEELIQKIVDLKSSVASEIELWQEQKQAAPDALVQRLNAQLDKMETVIKRFLTAEKQLEKQISFYRKES